MFPTYFASQIVWDLGCKHSDFFCYCPFDKRFETFLDRVSILDELKDHAGGACKCKNKNKGHTYAELTQHINGSNYWLHRMLGFYMHFLYDKYNENNMKFIALETVDRGRKRKHEMKFLR